MERTRFDEAANSLGVVSGDGYGGAGCVPVRVVCGQTFHVLAAGAKAETATAEDETGNCERNNIYLEG
ncbi:hypothetical protein [Alicyclobacillus sp. ALC3]|uniref:hypothetical protein n=1 Tax=Alicyclobacillus sp. ALC3 TaxID=2796143 RepID=UPI002379605C|nr:hypothetical protein [Alicyclobacillus sp. ALC3]WDL98821.1 hypothetical protein JC200_09295 [Alicyclobacillus sp. ALC3]